MTSDATSSTYDPVLLPNTHDPQRPLLTVNLTNVTKLTAGNYMTWSLQIQSLLEGYDLHRFIDATHAPPLPTVVVDDTPVPNPAYTAWLRQDRLLFSALLGSLTPALQPLVARTTSSIDFWRTLRRTYATPSRGHIQQLKDQLRRCHKGSWSVDEFMQDIKIRADALALLGKPVDDEDLVDRVLSGLGEEYRAVTDAINARETLISFPELHEKLLNREALILAAAAAPTSFPVTANPTAVHHWSSSRSQSNRTGHTHSRAPRPYLGRCQACGTTGHSAKRCPSFQIVPLSTPPSQQQSQSRSRDNRPPPWQPRANHAALGADQSSSWLLDSGASHHVAADLQQLSLHHEYPGSDRVMIGDGSGLQSPTPVQP